MSHTKGPWERKGDHIVGERYVCELSDWCITGPGSQYQEENDALRAERDANARLIAAAPSMLAALEDIYQFLKQSGYDTRIVKHAIDTAKGSPS